MFEVDGDFVSLRSFLVLRRQLHDESEPLKWLRICWIILTCKWCWMGWRQWSAACSYWGPAWNGPVSLRAVRLWTRWSSLPHPSSGSLLGSLPDTLLAGTWKTTDKCSKTNASSLGGDIARAESLLIDNISEKWNVVRDLKSLTL